MPAASSVRRPAVQGQFYAGDPAALRDEVDACFADPRGPGALKANPRTSERSIRAAIVPHAGFPYSGPIAAHAYAAIARERPPASVLILGVDHHGVGGLGSLSARPWRTPLGEVPIDGELLSALHRPPLAVDEAAHALEHSIEVQLPFLQRVLPGVPFVPLQVHYASFEALSRVAAVVREAIHGRDTLLIASTDFTHYEPAGVAEELDRKALAPILRQDARGLYEVVAREELSMCGIAPTTVLLAALADEELSVRLLRYGHSGEAAPMEEVVGYAALILQRPVPR